MSKQFEIDKLEERIAPSVLGLLGGNEDGSAGGNAHASTDGSHASADGNANTDVGGVDLGGIGHGNNVGNNVGQFGDVGNVSDVGQVSDAGNIDASNIASGDNGNLTDLVGDLTNVTDLRGNHTAS